MNADTDRAVIALWRHGPELDPLDLALLERVAGLGGDTPDDLQAARALCDELGVFC